MVKDEDICVHCGLCAERCPTAAWDMQLFTLRIPYAGHAAGPPPEADVVSLAAARATPRAVAS
jgi:ferredoxin